jgi:hypothetical protein
MDNKKKNYSILETICFMELLFTNFSNSDKLLGNPSRTPISLLSKYDIAVAILEDFSKVNPFN